MLQMNFHKRYKKISPWWRFTRLNAVADAFDLDMDNIEAGDYSLTNLKALES